MNTTNGIDDLSLGLPQPATVTRPLPPLPTHFRYASTSNPPSPDGGPSPRPSSSGSTPRGRPLERESSSRVPSPATAPSTSTTTTAFTKRGSIASPEGRALPPPAVASTTGASYDGHPAENNPNYAAGAPGATGAPAQLLAPVSLPPTALILEALNPFFLHCYDTFYFLHRPTLTDQIKAGTAPKELLCCILAFASRYFQPLRDRHPSSPNAASEHYASLATQLLSSPASNTEDLGSHGSDPEISMTRCHCFLMLGLWECTEGAENKGWLRIGAAIRMAQILRLGFQDEDDESTPPDATSGQIPRGDPMRGEIRRRTFWACFLLDRTVTDGKERPTSLRPPLSSALRMPGADADFAASRRSQGARFDADVAPWNVSAKFDPVTSPTPEADLYGHTLRIAEIWNQVVTYIGSGGRNHDRRAPWLPESTFATLDRTVRTWDARLPAVFRYNEANLVAHSMIGQGRLFGMLHLLYACSNLVLHRDYLAFLPPVDYQVSSGPSDGEPLYGQSFAPPGWWETSLTQAIDAAGVISDLSTNLSRHGSPITHPFAGFAVVAASTMHAHLKYWPQSCRTRNIDAGFYLEQDMAILNSLREVYPIANNWCQGVDRLNVLYSNVVRGVLNGDASKVRAGVIKLLRTAKEDDISHANGNPSDSGVPASSTVNAGTYSDTTPNPDEFTNNQYFDSTGGDLLSDYSLDLSVLDGLDWNSFGEFGSWTNWANNGLWA